MLLAASPFRGGVSLSDLYIVPAQAVTPTPDRLAEPTLPAAAGQADLGAQVYWLWCLPCHGDRGQGLTDEFRKTYPPEEEYCWEGGCHGERPYEDGFKLPPKVPPVVGPSALRKFPTAANLQGYIAAAMPYWRPGSLTEEENWQVTSFLLRENGIWMGADLGDLNAGSISVGPPVPTAVAPDSVLSASRGSMLAPAAMGLGAGLLLLYVVHRSRRRR